MGVFVTHVRSLQLTKSITPLWVYFTFLKLYKWYQIAQSISYYSTAFVGMNRNQLLNCRLIYAYKPYYD